MSKTVVIFGATGIQGGGAARYLLNDGTFRVRAVTRSPASEAAKALASLGAEVVKADLNDKASLVSAMNGAYGVFGVTDYWTAFKDEETQGKNLVDAAAETGIQHFVWSTLDRTPDLAMPYAELKANVDDYLKASGVPRTSLYTAFFLENIGAPFFCITRDSIGNLLLDTNYVSDGVIPTIAGEDCGVIAAIVLINSDKFIGKDIFAATEITTPRKVAAIVQDLLGEQVKVKEVTMEQFHSQAIKDALGPIWAGCEWFYKYGQQLRDIPATLAILSNPTTTRMMLERKVKDGIVS